MQTKLLGADKGPFPTFVINKGRKNYVITRESDDEPLTYESIRSFIFKYTSGVLDPVSKSQPIPDPKTNADKAVKDVVGLNFRDVVLNSKTDVIVKFYATWCTYCKKFEPIYEEAAKAMKSAPVLFAQVDAAENDVPEFISIQQYPTVALFPANNKSSPIYFRGQRSVDKLIEFVHGHAGIKYKLPSEAKEILNKIKAEAEAERKRKEEEEKMKHEDIVDEEEEEEEVVIEETKTKEEL